MKYFKLTLMCLIFATQVQPVVYAQSKDDNAIEEVVTIGSRSHKPRTALDSTVPVDVISGEDFNNLAGTADLTDNLKALIPSYTATPATGDGSAFVRPTSLRGTAPDQTLVLVNGKRRHRSALVQFFAPAAGNGAHGVDVGMIPGIALKRVEVLRDGAAAQYGSDAIAGVINFVLKDAPEGGEVQVQYGEFYEGEQSKKVSGNIGLPLGANGFVNASIEYIDNDALSRGVQRPDAQALIDAGVTEVGQDAPFGDAPLAQTWGRPQTEGTRFFGSAGYDFSDIAQLYTQVSYADTDGRYRFFYRSPTHSTFTTPLAFGAGCPTCDPNDPTDTMTLRQQGFTGLPGGFTPFLDGHQKDSSFVIGMKGESDASLFYDLSVGYGKNKLDYFLNNTVNLNLGPGDLTTLPKMDFDVGGYRQEEVNVNADFSMPFGDAINLGFGMEWREETYTVKQGEPDAFFMSGSSGFKGITPADSGKFSRDNWATYVDVEYDVTEDLLLQVAGRYEDFSDFGSTINGKFAARYSLSDMFTLRGAVSTGFHAPTPGQANVRTTITTFDGVTGLQVEEGLVPSTDPRVAAVGGTELQEETSLNFSAGFAANFFDNTTMTVDFYQIKVDDRIYRTGDIAVPGSTNTISFYTNALNVKHSGVDVVLTSQFEWAGNASTDLTFAYGYNKVNVTSQKPINGVNPVSDGLIEDIENNYPHHRFTLTTNTFFGEKINFLARANFYGSSFDERGRIGDAVNPSAKIGSVVYVDLELGYQATQNIKLVAGGNNIFDEFVDEVGPPNANRLSVGLQYPRRSAANYEGGSWYLRGIYTW